MSLYSVCFSCIVMLLIRQAVRIGGVSFVERHCMDSLSKYPEEKG